MPTIVKPMARRQIDPDLPEEERRRLEKVEAKRIRSLSRRAERLGKDMSTVLEVLYKPIEDWDDEELARGRPRSSDGSFSGRTPAWISRAVHEAAISRFTEVTKGGLRGLVPKSILALKYILECEEVDERGRLVVPPGVRLQAAQWTIEHLVGKATQRIEADVSVKLQGILAQVMVGPENLPDALGKAIGSSLGGHSTQSGDKQHEADEVAIEASSTTPRKSAVRQRPRG